MVITFCVNKSSNFATGGLLRMGSCQWHNTDTEVGKCFRKNYKHYEKAEG